jgi:hypothetical protein
MFLNGRFLADALKDDVLFLLETAMWLIGTARRDVAAPMI